MTGFEYDESYLPHGYKELTIPPAPDGSWRMEKNALHIWPRKSFMMIALPNPDGSFTCTLFWEFKGPRSFESTKTDDDVRRFFDEEFPDAVPLMPALLEDFRENPTGSLVTIRCAPWFYKDKVALVGDAAHAVVPFYGQGMNAAFEDCVVLDECLAEFPDDRERAFSPNISLGEKRTPTRSPTSPCTTSSRCATKPLRGHFRAKKKLDHLLEALLPGVYLPLYAMVTFTRIPYAEAARRARLQDRIRLRRRYLSFDRINSLVRSYYSFDQIVRVQERRKRSAPLRPVWGEEIFAAELHPCSVEERINVD